MNCILFDFYEDWVNLLPLSYTRPVSEIRMGILTIKEKWEKHLNASCGYLTRKYLQNKFKSSFADKNTYINGSILPNRQLIQDISELKLNQALFSDNHLVAFKSEQEFDEVNIELVEEFERVNKAVEFTRLQFVWDIFRKNGQEIENDYHLLTAGRQSAKVNDTNRLVGEHIFIEEGVTMEFATISAKGAYVYIGANSEIMEGAIIRGSFALGEYSTVKMGAKIYGPTTVGPHSKIGGEVTNSVLLGYSNKGHEGYLGNSVLGEWCNLGADTNISNLKNNYAEIRLWNYAKAGFAPTGLQFCGLIMGDHSKCGINTMFNTGTIVGVNANIYGAGFPRNFVPSFSWGGALGFKEYQLKKAFEVNKVVMGRRDMEFNDTEKDILLEVFEMTKKYRRF
jgi:UDP-N-acetylglucosamine diphosphorylase/glucosamine-1-phosphate N-acetyltransferase